MKTVKTKNVQKFTIGMKKKLVVLFILVLLAFAGLAAKLISITANNGKEYEKMPTLFIIFLAEREIGLIDCL